VNTVPSQVK